MITYKGAPKSRAAIIKEQLALQKRNKLLQETTIDLYPETPQPNYHMRSIMRDGQKAASHRRMVNFQESVMKEMVTQAIFSGMVEPVLNEAYANDHHKELAFRTVVDFVNEQDCYDLIRSWKYKNLYLAEFAQAIENGYKAIVESAKDKIREGLNEKDAFQVENNKIDDYIISVQNIIPQDITNTITKRVEDSISDFVADNQDKRDRILTIYQKAQDKIASITDPERNPALQTAYPDGQTPQDVDQDLVSQAEPGVTTQNPNPDIPGTTNPNFSADETELQQEAVRSAKRKESQILNEGTTSIFGEMTKILSEAALTIPSLQQMYLNENGRLDMSKVLGDVRSIYTFLETMNTIGVIEATPQYMENTLNGMRESLEKASQDEKRVPTGDKVEPKEKTHGDGSRETNNPNNDFDI